MAVFLLPECIRVNPFGNNRYKYGRIRVSVGPARAADRSRPSNGDLGTVENLMSHLSLVKKAIGRKQRLTEASLAHLRYTAYRGINTSAHQPPHKAYGHPRLTYRGISYTK